MAIGAGPRVFCHNGREIGQYVHTDFLFQAYFVACVNLLGGADTAGAAYPVDAGNPYGQFIDNTGTGLPLPAGLSGSPADIGWGRSGHRRSRRSCASRRLARSSISGTRSGSCTAISVRKDSAAMSKFSV
jgi:hypothetical protein